MKITYLFSDWHRVEEGLKDKFVYLFLDYDGTLAPIAETPAKAFIPKKTKKILLRLSETPGCKIAIISGRALSDLKRRVGLKNIIYAGNFGFEIKGPAIKFESPVPIRYRKTLEEIKDALEKRLAQFKGALIEDKGFSLSIHYRLVDKKRIPALETEFYSTVAIYEVKGMVKIGSGKRVLEVRPPIRWDKGRVVLWLLARQRFASQDKNGAILPIYIGDDISDEDAFESLRGCGLTVFVGTPKETNAQFYLKNSGEVANLLKLIYESAV